MDIYLKYNPLTAMNLRKFASNGRKGRCNHVCYWLTQLPFPLILFSFPCEVNTSKDDESLPLNIGSTLYKMAQIGSRSLLYKIELTHSKESVTKKTKSINIGRSRGCLCQWKKYQIFHFWSQKLQNELEKSYINSINYTNVIDLYYETPKAMITHV